MKKSIVLTAVSLAISGSLIGGGILAKQSKADDSPPIVTEVNHLQDVSNNHEVRIKNLENDTSNLKTNTNTPSSQSNVTPPAVNSQPVNVPINSAVVEAAPVTVSSYILDSQDSDGNQLCHVTYSDGSTHSFYARQVNGQNVAIALCDDTMIGKPKADTYTGF